MARKTYSKWFLKEWREHRGKTQDQLAEMTGLSKPYISQLERGQRQYTQELLELFAEALQCGIDDLVRRGPGDAQSIQAAVANLTPQQEAQVVAIVEAIKRTGTSG